MMETGDGDMEIRGDDDVHGMDYGDYLERLNVTLKAMVALEPGDGAGYTSAYLAKRFDEAMLNNVSEMLQRVRAVVDRAVSAGS